MTMLAGVSPFGDDHVRVLAALLQMAGADATADTLDGRSRPVGRWSRSQSPDREAILSVLKDPPYELAELRGVLLREHEWRLREGL